MTFTMLTNTVLNISGNQIIGFVILSRTKDSDYSGLFAMFRDTAEAQYRAEAQNLALSRTTNIVSCEYILVNATGRYPAPLRVIWGVVVAVFQLTLCQRHSSEQRRYHFRFYF